MSVGWKFSFAQSNGKPTKNCTSVGMTGQQSTAWAGLVGDEDCGTNLFSG